MSWDAAIKYLGDYRKARQKSLNNLTRQQWFTSPSATLPDVFKPFDRASENTMWETEYDSKKNGKVRTIMALGAKINFLAGCSRDLRIQFAAGSDLRVRRPIDWDRYEYMACNFADYKLREFDIMLKSWEE